MVNFLLPITFFSKTYSYSVAEPMAMVSFPFMIIVILIQLYRFPNRIKNLIPTPKAFFLAAFVWFFQLLAMFLSYRKTGETLVTWGLLHSPITLAGWTLAVYIAWAVIQVTVITEKDEKQFIKAGIIGLLFYLIFVLFPQVFLTVHLNIFNDYVNLLAKFFEERWKSMPGYDFYSNGSYSATQLRVNGFEPEASYLANLLSVTYVPILIGITVTGQRIWLKINSTKLQLIFNVSITFIVLLILIFAKTTTGILAAIVAYFIWISWSRGALRKSILWIAFIGIIFLIAAYLKIGVIHNMLNQFLFAKQGTDNRWGGTIGLALTFLSHPILGVGTGFTSYFTIENFPISASQNFEFQHVYSQTGFPILSEFLGWLSTFGMIIVIPALMLLGNLIARSFLIESQLNGATPELVDQSWSRSLHISFISMIILVLFSSIFIIRIYLWPYLLMFFFYRKHIMRLEEELKQ